MLEFQSSNLNKQAWHEFNEPRGAGKTVRLFHKGWNGHIVYVTDEDDVYVARQEGHVRLAPVCGRNITRLASFKTHIVAGNDTNEIILLRIPGSIAHESLILSSECLEKDYWVFETRGPECYSYSITPRNNEDSLVLAGCGLDFVLATDEARKRLKLVVAVTSEDDSVFYTVNVTRDSEGEINPLVQISCGYAHVSAIDSEGSAYSFSYGSDVVDLRLRKAPSLPAPAKSVACAWNSSAFLLLTGQIIISEKRGEFSTFLRVVVPPVVEITSSHNHFAASTGSSIIRFFASSKIDAVFEGETCLLKAFEDCTTPPMCSSGLKKRGPLESLHSSLTARPSVNGCLFDNEHLSDISLALAEGTIRAHKTVLSCYSKYFDNLFKSEKWKNDSSNSSLNVIDVSNYNSDAYRAYIRFIYCGCLDWSGLSCDELTGVYTIAADNEEDFAIVIYSALLDSFNADHVSQLFRFAVERNLKELEERCFREARSHKIEVITSDSFSSLPLALKKRLAEISFK